jgi:hypothetical protein
LTLNSVLIDRREADAMGNPTGEHAFYFNNLKIEQPSAGIAADFDEDDDVDAADLTKWKAGLGTIGAATHMQGDADGDLDLDGQDFLVWQRQLGSTAAVAAGMPIPEPKALLLMSLISCSLAMQRPWLRRAAL